MKGFGLVFVLGLGACSLTQEQFSEQQAEIACRKSNECLQAGERTESMLDCAQLVSSAAEAPLAACDFDPTAATRCLEELENAGCDDNDLVIIPVSCADTCPPDDESEASDVDTDASDADTDDAS